MCLQLMHDEQTQLAKRERNPLGSSVRVIDLPVAPQLGLAI
jgi:hypothetical protein